MTEKLKPMVDMETKKSLVLARLRSYGPAFDFELMCECFVKMERPQLVIEKLVADGYRIDHMRCYREAAPGESRKWVSMYALRVRLVETGEVATAPSLPDAGLSVEIW